MYRNEGHVRRTEARMKAAMSQVKGEQQFELALISMQLRNITWLRRARRMAEEHCKVHQWICSDDLRLMVYHGKLEEPPHQNLWGAVFRSLKSERLKWQRFDTCISKWPSNNARKIGVWRRLEPWTSKQVASSKPLLKTVVGG